MLKCYLPKFTCACDHAITDVRRVSNDSKHAECIDSFRSPATALATNTAHRTFRLLSLNLLYGYKIILIKKIQEGDSTPFDTITSILLKTQSYLCQGSFKVLSQIFFSISRLYSLAHALQYVGHNAAPRRRRCWPLSQTLLLLPSVLPRTRLHTSTTATVLPPNIGCNMALGCITCQRVSTG